MTKLGFMSTARERVAVVALAIAAAVLVAGCGSTTSTGAGQPPRTSVGRTATSPSTIASPATQARIFRAFRSDGSPSVVVSGTSNGTCWTSSVAAPVRGAYRCFSANKILDPCFVADAHARTALCMLNPWSDAHRLRLTAPLPNAAPLLDPARPWAVQLANGARCVAVTGTAPSVAGVSLAYSCGHGYGAALITTRATVMTAHYARAGAARLQTVAVAEAWRVRSS